MVLLENAGAYSPEQPLKKMCLDYDSLRLPEKSIFKWSGSTP
jgi:hypothetical protein